MRWVLVFMFLYIIPIWVLFTNYKSFKRACIYGSIYITLSTTLVISNIYLSGLKVLEETADYEDNIALETYMDNKDFECEEKEVNNIQEKEKNQLNELSKKEKNLEENKETNYKISNEDNKKSSKVNDLEEINKFKKEIYSIERVALIPMRECLPYTNNLQKSLSNLAQVKEDVTYAKKMCQEIIGMYEEMEVPNLSKEEYTKCLHRARQNVIKTYKLRTLAMDNSIKLIESKNPMYINKITDYLKQSDKEIEKFKEEINKLKLTIKNN